GVHGGRNRQAGGRAVRGIAGGKVMSERAGGCLAIILCCTGSVYACAFAQVIAWRLSTRAVVPAQILILLTVAGFFGVAASAVVANLGRRADPVDRLRVVTAAAAISVVLIGTGYFAYLCLLTYYLMLA